MAPNTALSGMNLSELTDHAGVRECLQFFTREKQWINEVHVQLCRVPAPTFLEQERAAWFLEQLRSYGCDASIDRAGNVVAALGKPPYVALTAHLDTVLAPRNKDEISLDGDGPPARSRGFGQRRRPGRPAGCRAGVESFGPAAGIRHAASCWWPTWAKRERATCWECATWSTSRRWRSRSRVT